MNPKVEESSSEEEDEDGRSIPKKKKVPPVFNVASLIGVDSKRLKILNIRKLRGDIIGASVPSASDLINNVFTSQSNPDSVTMSIYNRPTTSPN